MIQYLKNRYRVWLSRKDKAYDIYDNGTHLALIKSAQYKDMFWSEYLLEPMSFNETHLSRLYSDTFWLGQDIVFKGNHSGLTYTFIIAIHDDKEAVYPGWYNEKGLLIRLSDRTKTILLRGPYLNTDYD